MKEERLFQALFVAVGLAAFAIAVFGFRSFFLTDNLPLLGTAFGSSVISYLAFLSANEFTDSLDNA